MMQWAHLAGMHVRYYSELAIRMPRDLHSTQAFANGSYSGAGLTSSGAGLIVRCPRSEGVDQGTTKGI